jgi:cell division septum initiation protein DivIVA
MTEQTLRRADGLLTELVELVETARTLPMSASCVVPRERVLDLLDELREVMPPEIDEARRVIANRDGLLHDAYTEATTAREAGTAEAEALRVAAQEQADRTVHDAEVRAYEIVEAGRAEHGRLVSATGVHQSATRAAAELREQAEAYRQDVTAAADEYRDQVRAAADRYDAELRADTDRAATKLTADSEDYADTTLAELAAALHRAAATAEQGRIALAQRRARHAPAPVEDPSISD